MPPKKRSWGDIPHVNDVKDKDTNGKWIHCKICDVCIRVRSQFSMSEWQIHTDGIKHAQLSNANTLKNVPKITNFFQTKQNVQIFFSFFCFSTGTVLVQMKEFQE